MDPEATAMQPQATRLTLEQQGANLMKNMFFPWDRPFEDFTAVVEMLRANPICTDVQAFRRSGTSLHWAVGMGDITMVAEILAAPTVDFHKRDNGLYNATALHYAVKFGNMDIVKLMLDKHLESGKGNPTDFGGRTALHWAILSGNLDIVKLMVAKHLESGKLDVNAVDDDGYTALHLAIVVGRGENTDMVRELLKCKDTMRLSEECKSGRTPLQIAHEKGDKDVQKALMEHESVRRYVEELYRDRQVYVDAANAILVGAALIASVTFGSWLQPPLGLTSDQHADIQHNIGLGAFWIFNSFSFYFAIATVVFGARSVLPRNVYFIKRTVEGLRKNLLITAFMLACSVFFVITAFGIAGSIVLAPMLKYQWYIIVPTITGGMVCLVSLGFLSRSMWEDSFGRSSIASRIEIKWLYERGRIFHQYLPERYDPDP